MEDFFTSQHAENRQNGAADGDEITMNDLPIELIRSILLKCDPISFQLLRRVNRKFYDAADTELTRVIDETQLPLRFQSCRTVPFVLSKMANESVRRLVCRGDPSKDSGYSLWSAYHFMYLNHAFPKLRTVCLANCVVPYHQLLYLPATIHTLVLRNVKVVKEGAKYEYPMTYTVKNFVGTAGTRSQRAFMDLRELLEDAGDQSARRMKNRTIKKLRTMLQSQSRNLALNCILTACEDKQAQLNYGELCQVIDDPGKLDPWTAQKLWNICKHRQKLRRHR